MLKVEKKDVIVVIAITNLRIMVIVMDDGIMVEDIGTTVKKVVAADILNAHLEINRFTMN